MGLTDITSAKRRAKIILTAEFLKKRHDGATNVPPIRYAETRQPVAVCESFVRSSRCSVVFQIGQRSMLRWNFELQMAFAGICLPGLWTRSRPQLSREASRHFTGHPSLNHPLLPQQPRNAFVPLSAPSQWFGIARSHLLDRLFPTGLSIGRRDDAHILVVL